MYFIELILTRKCNQACFYCTTHSKGSTEVDIDYLKYVLDLLPDETGVELTGGEIGLIENIDEVYQTVKRHKNIMHIMVLSNGLMRLRNTSWLNEVEYWEHLIYEIEGKRIIKFYDELGLDEDHRYIIVTTKNTIQSLLDNWDYFYDKGMFKENFFYKLMNHKSQYRIDDYHNDLFKFYSLIGNVYFIRMLLHWRFNSHLKDQKRLCQKYSPNPFIDFETKQLGHCAINVNESIKVDFNKENLQKMMKGDLSQNTYCKHCYTFDNGKNRSMLNNRSYEQ
jgi:MoaA/NifB/PqqE/SkfB family radical SAM enzyme